jgi:pyruvate kinase
MLSAETSVGKYPFESVNYMSKIIENIETAYPYYKSGFDHQSNEHEKISDSLGKAATVIAERINASAIVTLTSSTYTAKNIANYRPKMPIVAMTDDTHIWRRLSFVWGVTPILVNEIHNVDDIFESHINQLIALDFIKHGDNVVFVAGLSDNKLNPQNMIKIYAV